MDITAATRTVDRASFDRTVLSHRSAMLGTAMRLTRSRDEAEDLVQEAVLRAWMFFDRFEEGTNARAWLNRILVNTFINGYRRRRREHDVLAQVQAGLAREAWLPASHHAPGEELGDEVQAALATLPREFRDVLVLVDRDETSYRDAARKLRCPIGTVMSRLHRARRALQARLGDYARREGYVAMTGTEDREAA